uniref:RNA-directed RNA polymerase n=1 Tax=Riboviria sp. TaxID=2585031 RepID=A0A6M3YNV2_9VIRU|nr:MAG: hypothetical protein 2 [Riboviria sp.]
MPVLGCETSALPLAKGCKILHVPVDLQKEVTRRCGTVHSKPTHCEKEFGLHKHRVIDELQTIGNRHLMETPEPDLSSRAWKLFVGVLRKTSRHLGLIRSAPVREVLEGKTGRRRKRFYAGIQQLADEGVSRRDARVTEMQKLEMYEVSKIKDKEDRGIQYRSVKYNVALARELHNVEKRVIGMHPDGYHPIMKGATPQQRAERLVHGSMRFKDPIYVLLDHRRFDAHVNIHLLREEHKFYMRCRRGSKVLRKLLRMQERNIGRTKGGIRYTAEGKRMSGDINTGLGNSVLNYGIIKAWLEASGVRGYVYLDGDDSVVIIERADYHKLVPLAEFMAKLGMVTEMEVTDKLWKAEFCQSRPVLVDGTVRYVRNPHKVLATVGSSAEIHDEETMSEVVRASCMCELALNGNCPVISPYCRRLLNIVGTGRTKFSAAQLWKAEQYGAKFEVSVESHIDDDARMSFWQAWGIEPGMQEVLECQDIIVGDPRQFKDRKVKNKQEILDPLDEWSGAVMGSCDCGECPVYDAQIAYDAARLLLK